MKKINFSLILLTIIAALYTPSAFAIVSKPTIEESLTTTVTPKPTTTDKQIVGEKLNQQISQLKERIASVVAEKDLVEKRAFIGIVSETSGNQITLNDLTGKTRYVDVDEITKFSSSALNSFGLSDLTKGTKISAFGRYNKQSQRILARFITTTSTPTYTSGRISNIDKKNYTIMIATESQKSEKIDIETFTNISTYLKDDGISKWGFSKLKIGDTVFITGYPDKKDSSIIVASRMLILPDVPVDPKIIISQPTDENTKITPTLSENPTIVPTLKKSPKTTVN